MKEEKITEQELDDIIRLIPRTNIRQITTILGQINVHLVLKFREQEIENEI